MGGFVRMYTPERTLTFEKAVEAAALDAMGLEIVDFPCRVDILAVFKRPKTMNRKKDRQGLLWKPTRPDSDNVRKAVLDGLSAVMTDDALVVDGRTCKVYGDKDQDPLVKVFIREVPEIPLDGRDVFTIADLR